MPQAIAADWELIRTLYQQGARCAEIEAQTGVASGTIASRASRCKWKAVAMKAKAMVQSSSGVVEIESDSKLDSHSNHVRNALGRDLKRVVELLEDAPLSSLPKALKRQQALEPLVRNARAVFGWSESGESPAIRIALLAAVQPQSLPAVQAQVIECEEVKHPFPIGQDGKVEGAGPL